MTISGFPLVFGSPSVDLGGFVEQIDPRAFDRTVSESIDVVALVNHDSNKPLGRTSARTLSLAADRRGVLARLDADETVTFVGDLVKLITRGDARGGSFAFTALDDIWQLRDGQPFRTVIDMRIREVSFGVPFPAYASSRLYVGDSAPSSTRSIAFAAAQLKQLRVR